MVKIFQITFLWIAGLLVIGHGIIPHHHHESDQNICAEDLDHSHNDHEHGSSLTFEETCCHEHETKHEACIIDHQTIVKENNTPLASILNGEFNLPDASVCTCKLNHQFSIGIVNEALWDNTPSRAPPSA